ncbi:LacI family DNA-binding transcriptional regulator [Mucilaginibacter agri]|uniref:Substrate-binding domain-containing protein n=1 Tax=Mucilaginibacter agri TaxID=2695265 RepID=A0A965ZBS4_9SPHI|nr:LacI family DNA-binding transcriptional regulator [Mucilaginibacter agri]NCD68118.1 substrate-binding domain-containing protein [Mucilaginibacter agri]
MLPSNKITLKKIAHDLNMSTSTISRALRDNHEINAVTKERILAYARELNFRPDTIARTLRNGKSKTIGVVLSTVENPFYSQVINGIESAAYQSGYNVCITQSHESYDLEKMQVAHLTRNSVDGILMSLAAGTTDTTYLKRIKDAGLPIVFFDNIDQGIDSHKVVADNFKGAFEATSQLLNSGYKNVAFISGPANNSITVERMAGYLKALTQNGIIANEATIKYCMHDGENDCEIENAIDELFLLDNRPDAIFTATDNVSTKVFQSIRRREIQIPDEVALFGFTNSKLAELTFPALSAVHQPGFEMGKKAAEMLLDLIKNNRSNTEYQTVVLPVQLFSRASSGSITILG